MTKHRKTILITGATAGIGRHAAISGCCAIAGSVTIGDHAVLGGGVQVPDHVTIGAGARIAGGAAVTHYATIGRYAFVGGLAGVVHDCPPYMMSDGHPARVRSVNTVGLARHGFDDATVDKLKKAFMLLWGQKARRTNRIGAAMEEAEATLGDDPHIMELINFTRRMVAATHGRHAESYHADDKRSTPTR